MAIIELDAYSYSYPDGRLGVDGITLSIERGQFVLICGPNGSGKTTFAQALGGLLEGGDPQGRLTVDTGEIGIVFQNPEEQMVGRTIELDVAFGPENLGMPPAEIRRRVMTALQTVDILHLAERPVSELSGGELQKVAIAGSLAMEAQILLLDEPTSQLDSISREEIITLLARLHHEGQTLIVVEQDIRGLLELADWVVLLNEGRIAVQGPPREIVAADAFWSSGIRIPDVTRLGIELSEHLSDVAIPLSMDEAVAMAGKILKPGDRPWR
ncbi:MAG: energy-coupling factor ABC transporter ATP-binding protein [Candidatus Bipolaricaulia bacterium]